MEPLSKLSAVAVPLALANINTDQLFPARFIKKPRSVGYSQYLFHDLRRSDSGENNPEFELNNEKFRTAKILVTGPNFGSGSSREGAVYALHDAGFRILLGSSFGEIFASSCLKNGMLAAQLNSSIIEDIQKELEESDNPMISVDVEMEQIRLPSGREVRITVDPFQKHCLTNGLNEIDLSLEFEAAISIFEENYRLTHPWTKL